MKLSKGFRIGIFLIIMFVTAIPTFLALASNQLVKWLFLNQEQIIIDASGYYLLPIAFIFAIAFCTSLVLLIKTIRAIGSQYNRLILATVLSLSIEVKSQLPNNIN